MSAMGLVATGQPKSILSQSESSVEMPKVIQNTKEKVDGSQVFFQSVQQEIEAKNSKIIVKWSKEPNAPLVMLFGWAGCNDRYLTKYSQIYEQKK